MRTQDVHRTIVAGRSSAAKMAATVTELLSSPSQPARTLGSTAMPGNVQREHVELVIDVSISMSEGFSGGVSKLEAAKNAAVNFIVSKHRLDPEDSGGLVSFCGKAKRVHTAVRLSEGKRDLLLAVQSLSIWGFTDLDAPLRLIQSESAGIGDGVTRRVVFLTDGHGGDPLRTADKMKSEGVVFDVIGIGDSPSSVNEKLLRQMASTVDGELRYRFIKDHQSLVTHYTLIAGKTQVAG